MFRHIFQMRLYFGYHQMLRCRRQITKKPPSLKHLGEMNPFLGSKRRSEKIQDTIITREWVLIHYTKLTSAGKPHDIVLNIDVGFGCRQLDIWHNIFSHPPTIGAPMEKTHTRNANPKTEIRRQHTCAACLLTAAVMLPPFDRQRSTRRSPEHFQWCICERRQPELLCEQGGIIRTKKICRLSLKKSTDSKLKGDQNRTT